MSSYYYWLAFNDLEDPYWACHYGVTTHPLYGQCGVCPSFSRCTSPLKQANILRATLDEPIKVTITITDDDDDYEYEPGKLPKCAKGGKACKHCRKEGTVDCTYIRALLDKKK